MENSKDCQAIAQEGRAGAMKTNEGRKAKAGKGYRPVCIWIMTVALHGAVYLSGCSLAVVAAAAIYIVLLLAVLIVGEVRKKPVIEFEKLVFIGILHLILLFHDVFLFFFGLSLETGNFHAR